MTVMTSASTKGVSGVLVDQVVRKMILGEIKKTDKESFESAGETLESVTSDATFLANERKLQDLKASLCTANMIDASIEWEKDEFAMTCEGEGVCVTRRYPYTGGVR